MTATLAALHFQIDLSVTSTRGPALLVLVAFLLSFGFIRTSARLMRSPRVTWWPGSVTTDSGLHIHHLVWGISLLLVSGFVAFATELQTPAASARPTPPGPAGATAVRSSPAPATAFRPTAGGCGAGTSCST